MAKRTFVISGLPGISGHVTLRVTAAAIKHLPTTAGGRLPVPKRIERFVSGRWEHFPSVLHVGDGPDTAYTVALTMQDGRLQMVTTDTGQPDSLLFQAAETAKIKTATVYPEALRQTG